MIEDEFLFTDSNNEEFEEMARLEERYGMTPDQIILRGFAIKNLKATLEIAENQGITGLDKTQLLSAILIEEAIEAATERLEKAIKKAQRQD